MISDHCSAPLWTVEHTTEDIAGQIRIFPDRPRFICTEDQKVSAFLLTSLGVLGVTANIILIIVICFKGSFKRWTFIFEPDLWRPGSSGALDLSKNHIDRTWREMKWRYSFVVACCVYFVSFCLVSPELLIKLFANSPGQSRQNTRQEVSFFL